MMLPSHLLAVLIVADLASRVKRFTPKQWALAVGFGVAIDLDHTIQFPAYVATHGLKGLDIMTIVHWGAAWQGFMHTPYALIPVVAAMLFFRSWVPLAFWLLHMAQDFIVAARYVVFGSEQEWVIVLILAMVATLLFLDDHRRHGSGAPFFAHTRARLGLARRSDATPAE